MWVTDKYGIVVISDKHPGIMRNMSRLGDEWEETYAYHRFCMRHHASNINTNHKDKYAKQLFIEANFEHELKIFDTKYEKLGTYNPAIKAELDIIPLSKWCLAHDGGVRYGCKTSNICECFNGVLKGVRFLPIVALVKATFMKTSEYFYDRREIAYQRMKEDYLYSAKVTEELEINNEEGRKYVVHPFSGTRGVLMVQQFVGYNGHIVRLREKTCTCNKWQNLHYSCSHVMTVFQKKAIDHHQYVDPTYTTKYHLKSYRRSFEPVPDIGYWKPWTRPKLLPNFDLRRGGGRPKSKRIVNVDVMMTTTHFWQIVSIEH